MSKVLMVGSAEQSGGGVPYVLRYAGLDAYVFVNIYVCGYLLVVVGKLTYV